MNMAGSYDFEEQERIAELKGWWEDNRAYIFAAATAVALGLGGWEGWKLYQERRDEDAAALFAPVTEALQTKDAKKIGAAAQKLEAAHPGSFYASQAARVAAKAAFDARDLEAARAQLEWVVNKGAEVHRGVARMRLAAVLLDQKKYDEALRALDASNDPGFLAMAADLRGDVMLAQGRVDEARAAYRLATEKADPRDPLKAIAQTKLDALGGTK